MGFLADAQALAAIAASRRSRRGRRAVAPEARPGGLEPHWGGAHVQLVGGAWGRPLSLLHPSGYTVGLTRLGKGHATTAYLGADGWVYLFTSDAARDPAKDVLAGVVARARSVHLPYIEPVGATHDADVWRMPRYRPLKEASAEVRAQGRALAKCADAAFDADRAQRWGGPRNRTAIRNATIECARTLARAKKLPMAVVTALQRLAEGTENYSDSWLFEFPPRNLMVDAAGRLILLDVIFDQEALIAYRRAQDRAREEKTRKAYRRW